MEAELAEAGVSNVVLINLTTNLIMPKNKFQDVNFETVEGLLEFLPADELKVTQFLRQLVFDCIPNVQEKISYNVPFYKVHKTICFIWPASVKWGKKQGYSGVRFGFQNGNLLTDEYSYLDRGNRKQVYYRDFLSIKEIDVELLRAFIFEAALIDQERKNIKKKTAWSR